MNKRRAVKEMFKSVQAGMAFTIKRKGEPVAMVLPWEQWRSLNQQLIAAEVMAKVPESRMARMRHALSEPACEHCGVVGGGHTVDCIGGSRG